MRVSTLRTPGGGDVHKSDVWQVCGPEVPGGGRGEGQAQGQPAQAVHTVWP